MPMRLNIEQLRTFLAVVRAGGVRRAAERMNVTQPAVSTRIKALETALGVTLFDRSAGMAPTKRGEALIRYAEQYLQLNELILRDVAVPDAIASNLRIGVSETIMQAWLPAFIARLRTAYPNLQVEIGVDISINLREDLLRNAVDLALLMGPVSDYRVDNIDLPQFPLTWFRAGHVAIPDDPEDLLRDHPLVTFARGTRPYRVLKTVMLERYGPGALLFGSSSMSAAFRMVAAGLGIGALPVALAADYLRSGEVRTFDPGWQPDPLTFTASFLREPDSAVSAHAAALALETALEYDKSLLSK